MKTKTMTRDQIAKHNKRSLRIGDRVTINFASRYWANGITGEVVEIVGQERRLFGILVASQDTRTGYVVIDCPASQIVRVA